MCTLAHTAEHKEQKRDTSSQTPITTVPVSPNNSMRALYVNSPCRKKWKHDWKKELWNIENQQKRIEINSHKASTCSKRQQPTRNWQKKDVQNPLKGSQNTSPSDNIAKIEQHQQQQQQKGQKNFEEEKSCHAKLGESIVCLASVECVQAMKPAMHTCTSLAGEETCCEEGHASLA